MPLQQSYEVAQLVPASNSIEIRSADTSWPGAFVQAAEELTSLLGAGARVEHIGSTAVPGLAAKPIIDILIGVAQANDVSNAGRTLVRLGFAPGEATNPGVPRAFFSRPCRGENPTINVHLTVAGCRQWNDLVRFRAALQDDAGLAARYEALKRRLAAASRGDLDAYTAGKTAFVAEVLEAAHR